MMTTTRRDFISLHPHCRAPDGYLLHVNWRAMACRFEVTLPLSDRAGVEAARRALDAVDQLEQQLSIFRDDSEVSRLNRRAAAEAIGVDASLFALLELCQELSRATRGAFDITAGPLSRCWGFVQRRGRMPDPGEIEAALSVVGSDKLRLDGAARTLRFARAGVEINLGSIGKGYALDRVAALIRERGRTALLSAGSSSFRAVGGGCVSARRGWLIGVRHPRHPERRLAQLRIGGAALSTSGGEEQFFEVDGRRYGHLIDPRSGQPADLVTSVTVVAPSAAVADALATAFYVGGPELARSYCAEHSEVLALMLERGSEQPVLFGANRNCEVEMRHE